MTWSLFSSSHYFVIPPFCIPFHYCYTIASISLTSMSLNFVPFFYKISDVSLFWSYVMKGFIVRNNIVATCSEYNISCVFVMFFSWLLVIPIVWQILRTKFQTFIEDFQFLMTEFSVGQILDSLSWWCFNLC